MGSLKSNLQNSQYFIKKKTKIMDLDDRITALEKQIGFPEDENDLTPIQVVNKANDLIKSSKNFDKLINNNNGLIDILDNSIRDPETQEGGGTIDPSEIQLLTKKHHLVELESLNSEIKSLQSSSSNDLINNLNMMKQLEPILDKSKETFNNLLEQRDKKFNQENIDPNRRNDNDENQDLAAEEALNNLASEIEGLSSQLMGMMSSYTQEIKEINGRFKVLEDRVVEQTGKMVERDYS